MDDPVELSLNNEYIRGQLDSIYRISEMIKSNPHPLLDKHQWYKEVLSLKPIRREDR